MRRASLTSARIRDDPNTAPFDVTGHPAMSMPCGMSDGLPVGLMLIGKHYDEATIYQAAAPSRRPAIGGSSDRTLIGSLRIRA